MSTKPLRASVFYPSSPSSQFASCPRHRGLFAPQTSVSPNPFFFSKPENPSRRPPSCIPHFRHLQDRFKKAPLRTGLFFLSPRKLGLGFFSTLTSNCIRNNISKK